MIRFQVINIEIIRPYFPADWLTGSPHTWNIMGEFYKDVIKVKLCNGVLVLQGMETYEGVAVLLGKEAEEY